jgi:hypothetical protein
VVEQLRADGRITSVFICKLGKKTKSRAWPVWKFQANDRPPGSYPARLLPTLQQSFVQSKDGTPKKDIPYVRFGSRIVRPFTWEKCRRLNVARVLPRCKAVAATIRS